MMKNMTREKKNSLIVGAVCLLLLLILDQLTKLWASHALQTNDQIELLSGIFELHYPQNEGAAFGIMENKQWLFVLFALLITIFVLLYYIRMPMHLRYRPLRIICVALAAGALGNMIDRIWHHYVIDFLYFTLIDFPIFNVADIYVCVSTAVFLLLILFYYKEEDFARIQGKRTRQEYLNELKDKIEESQTR